MQNDTLTPRERTHARLSAADQHIPAPTTAQISESDPSYLPYILAGLAAFVVLLLGGAMMIGGAG